MSCILYSVQRVCLCSESKLFLSAYHAPWTGQALKKWIIQHVGTLDSVVMPKIFFY